LKQVRRLEYVRTLRSVRFGGRVVAPTRRSGFRRDVVPPSENDAVNQDKSLPRIAALLRQAEGTDNEHEADAFMQAAQRLATAASIDLAVARAHTADNEARSVPMQKAIPIGEAGTRGLRTYVELFLAIGRANDVTCDIARDSSTVYCYGFRSDISTCQALYASLAVQMVRACDSYIKSGAFRAETTRRLVTTTDDRGRRRRHRQDVPIRATTARINFQLAYARRIGTRLAAARDAARAEAIATEPTQTSTELVLRGKEVELRDFYTANSTARGTWQGFTARAGYSSHARRAGDRAARQARLGRARELGGSPRALDDGMAVS
jgi:hypothetical protein